VKAYKINGRICKLVKGLVRETDIYSDGKPLLGGLAGNPANCLKACVYRELTKEEIEKASK